MATLVALSLSIAAASSRGSIASTTSMISTTSTAMAVLTYAAMAVLTSTVDFMEAVTADCWPSATMFSSTVTLAIPDENMRADMAGCARVLGAQ